MKLIKKLILCMVIFMIGFIIGLNKHDNLLSYMTNRACKIIYGRGN